MINSKGFSLIEVMVTMLIVSVGMLALGSFYLSAIQSEGRAQERVVATHFAEQILEDWQINNAVPTPDCKVAGVAASVLTPGATKSACIPNTGIPVPFDILIKVSNALAPIPNGHLLHSSGVGAPKMGNMLTVPANPASTKVKVRTVKVSWTVSNVTRDVVLTHITRKP